MTSELANEEEETTESPPPPEFEEGSHVAMQVVLRGNVRRLIDMLDTEDDPYREICLEQLNLRNDEAKSPLDMAAILGRVELAKELMNRGAEVNSTNSNGYSSLHRGAAWGRIGVLKALVEHGADLQLATCHKERARETAVRYEQTECVDYLDWAEAKIVLQETIRETREIVQDPEKAQGRLTKDDKNTCMNVCHEKSEWIENTPEATTQDFIMQKTDLDKLLAPILVKLSEPPPDGEDVPRPDKPSEQ